MGQLYDRIPEPMIEFIARQKIFFVGTAGGSDTRVNVSPKGMDSLRVLSANRVIWLNTTGSGNETAAHLLENDRMTVMFCSFEEKPMILRLYGTAATIHPRDAAWPQLFEHFDPLPGARQIFDFTVTAAQTSCGKAVPFFDYRDQREQLSNWAATRGPEGVREYWAQKNQTSLDGKPTRIFG